MMQPVIGSQLLKMNICDRIAFMLHDSPPYVSAAQISQIGNIRTLKILEQQYDDFLERKIQILLLLNCIEDVLEIREQLIIKINRLLRTQ